MSFYENETTKMILEILKYAKKNGEYPTVGVLASNGHDMGKALTRFRTGEVKLTEKQVEMFAMVDDFLSRTEKNIQKLESFYKENGYLPVGEEQKQLVDILWTYKSGKVPINFNQKQRLEAIGAFLSNTERMIRSIEAFYRSEGTTPRRGDKTKDGYDMGNAIIGYRNGKRQLTLNQKNRLEAIGIKLPYARIKDESKVSVRIIPEKSDKTLSERIKKLKQQKESLLGEESNAKKKF